MYRNEGKLPEKTYSENNNHQLVTIEGAIQEFESLHDRIDRRVQSLATRTQAPTDGGVTKENIETINRLKSERMRVKAALVLLQDMDETEWKTKCEEFNETFAKANQSVVDL